MYPEIKKAITDQLQQNNPVLKRAKDSNRYILKEDIQMTDKHENMFNIISHQGSVNKKHNEIALPIHQDEYN